MQENLINEELLKLDRRGRVRYSRQRRELLLDEFEKCGVSALEFAATIGVHYSTFAHWRQKRHRARANVKEVSALSEGSPQWVEAVVEVPHGCRSSTGEKSGVWLELPGGARLEITEGRQSFLVAALLRALESKSAPAC